MLLLLLACEVLRELRRDQFEYPTQPRFIEDGTAAEKELDQQQQEQMQTFSRQKGNTVDGNMLASNDPSQVYLPPMDSDQLAEQKPNAKVKAIVVKTNTVGTLRMVTPDFKQAVIYLCLLLLLFCHA